MKKVLKVLLPVLLIASLFGCTSKPKEEDPNKLSGKVVVYSPHGDEILTAISEWFEEATGVQVEYLFLGGAELVDRIGAEKNNPQADIIYGNPSNVFEQMKRDDLLQKYDLKSKGEMDEIFIDKDGYYYGTIQTPVLIYYNKDVIKAEDAPKDWKDLADPKYKDQLMFRSITSAASKATFSALIEQYDRNNDLEGAWTFLKGIDANTVSYLSNSGLVFENIAKNEAAIGFWTLDGITAQVDKGGPFEIVAPTSGAVVIADGIAMINGAKNQANAEAFMEFAASAEVQARLANEFNRMPTNKNAIPNSPAWMGSFTYPIMDVNWATLTDKQNDWMQYFNDNIVSSSKVE